MLEAFQGHDFIHVIDFSLMQGLLWSSLIQALALCPKGPALLLIPVLAHLNVNLAFRRVLASRLDDIKPWLLQGSRGEAIAVNLIFELHKLIGLNSIHGSPIELVQNWVRNLTPKVITIVEQEVDHNQAEFLDLFTEALFYYSTMFDSLEASSAHPKKGLAQLYMKSEICNIVSCEAGFKPLELGSITFEQASMMLSLFLVEGYCVEEKEGCLTLVTNNLRGSKQFIIQNPPHFSQHLTNDIVHYNPSNIGLWVERITHYGSGKEFLQHHFPKNQMRTRRFQYSVNPRDDDLCRDNPMWQSLIGLHFGRETPRSFGMHRFNIRHWQGINSVTFLPENEILYHNFYKTTTYLKFAYFRANQAILEAFQGHDFVHVIVFSLMQGLQRSSLIQALALRPKGPPLLHITSIGPPSTNDRNSLGEIVNVNLAFRGVEASRFDDIKPRLLQISQGETIAVNSILELHKLIELNLIHGSPIELVLNWFLDRFTEALFYYSTMFDSLEASSTQLEKGLAQLYMKRDMQYCIL
ncbi:hypothetical protein M9H77_01881 [Catharanthus roseus]|uniref:Uncharacterized protein n=1 Tax=Catharanthus roseus TaxID=4058 RepID=A0ACC0C771_CATRO|nr:hypothetical protein M9H77_01881 [Catharanthus roseus]